MDPCVEGTCLPPAEFVRLRYFFGQRLGVVDLADEQSYHAGKQRFHNLRLHGIGVLCGLRAERYVYPQGSAANQPTTLLRVHRGAALDACGREIVVGFDQCIDVAAWFAQHPKARPVINPGTTPPPLKLWVALCYRECPSDPAPAPRDPCGCDANGCEFARIREGFELKLLTDAEAKLIAPARPARPDLGSEGYLAGSFDDSFNRMVGKLASADCPEPPADSCLLLARFEAVLNDKGNIVNIQAPDNTIPERRSLLPTATLQEMLIRAFAAAGDTGLLGSGPHFGGVTFQGNGSDSGTLSVEILTDGTPLSRDPLASPERLTLKVSRFENNDWVSSNPDTFTYDAGPPSRIALSWSTLLVVGRYRLVIENDLSQPAVDQKMRLLTPTVWARHFRLEDHAGTLTLADSLF
jgi:hypothetical protein